MKSTYSTNLSLKEFAPEFASNEDLGFELIDVKYANEYWFGAYGKNIGYGDGRDIDTTWTSRTNFSDFEERVEDLEADGYYLTDIEYTDDGYWFGIFDDAIGSEIVVAETPEDFNSQVFDLKDQDSGVLGYHLVDFEYADGLSVGVLNKHSGDSTYSSSGSFSEFEVEIERQQGLGFELTNLEYIEGTETYVGIYTNTQALTGMSDYSPELHADINDFGAEIEDFQDIGYDLINVEFIEGEWFGIYKEDTDFTGGTTSGSGSDTFDPSQNVLDTTVSDYFWNTILDS